MREQLTPEQSIIVRKNIAWLVKDRGGKPSKVLPAVPNAAADISRCLCAGIGKETADKLGRHLGFSLYEDGYLDESAKHIRLSQPKNGNHSTKKQNEKHNGVPTGKFIDLLAPQSRKVEITVGVAKVTVDASDTAAITAILKAAQGINK